MMIRRAGEKYLFLKTVEEVTTKVIEPAMRKIIKELHSRGQEAIIARECQSITESGALRQRHITLILSDDNRKPAYNFLLYPAIGFVADSQNERILVQEKRVTATGKRENIAGECRIGEITGDLVEKYIRTFLPKVLKNV